MDGDEGDWLKWGAAAAVIAAAMVAAGLAAPRYADIGLAIFYFPAIPAAIVLLGFAVALRSRRLSLAVSVLVASPALMLVSDDGAIAVLLFIAIFLIGLSGIVAAVVLQLVHEMVQR